MKKFSSLLFLKCLFLSPSVHAIPISWDSPGASLQMSPLELIAVTNLQSDGSDMDNTFYFACGSFENGFEPSSDNLEDWAENFVALGVTRYSTRTVTGPPQRPDNRFIARRELENNLAPFDEETPPYIWGFNIDPVTGLSDEWILINRPDWVWPLASGSTGGDVGVFSVNDNDELTTVIGTVTNSSVIDDPLMTTAAVSPGLSTPRIDYDEWVLAIFPIDDLDDADGGVSAPNEDRDGDGVTNYDEFLAGFDPLEAQPAGVTPPTFQLQQVAVSGQTFFEGSIMRSALADVSWVVEESTTLQIGAWRDLTTTGTIVADTNSLLTVRSGVSVEDDLEDARFFRLRIQPNE